MPERASTIAARKQREALFLELAQRCMLAGQRIDPIGLVRCGFAYRDGKDSDDLRKAVRAGLKAGLGRVEHEMAEVAARLERVLVVLPPPMPFAQLREAYEQARANAQDNGGTVRSHWADAVRDIARTAVSSKRGRIAR